MPHTPAANRLRPAAIVALAFAVPRGGGFDEIDWLETKLREARLRADQ